MTEENPGYLIPENPEPADFICLKVFIPADDYYLFAFAGAYQFFGKWLAWERDSSHRGRLAARAWNRAIQKTFDEAWLNCEGDVCEHCDLIPTILDRLEELTNMNINVNCGGCGCGQQSSCLPVSVIVPPPGSTYPNPYPEPTPSPTDPTGLQWKCNLAHYCAYLWRLWGLYSTTINGVGLITDSVNQVYDDLGITPPSSAHAIAVAAVATMLNVSAGSDDITIPFDDNYEVIVCSIYSAPTDAAAYNNLDSLAGIFGFAGAGMLPLISLLPLGLSFDPQPDFTNLPPSYQQRDCSNCGIPPGQDDAWQLSFGIVGNHSGSYGQNTESEHDLVADTSGGGSGASFQQVFDELISMAGQDPDTWTHNIVTFTIEAQISAPAGNACERTIKFGGVNNESALMTVTNANGAPASDGINSTVWIGLETETPPAVNDIEIQVPNRSYLTPRFAMNAVGYGAQATHWELTISNLAMTT